MPKEKPKVSLEVEVPEEEIKPAVEIISSPVIEETKMIDTCGAAESKLERSPEMAKLIDELREH